MSARPSVYLDNNIVSAIAKNDEPTESDALDRLLEAKDEGKVHLVTSELTLTEIRAYLDLSVLHAGTVPKLAREILDGPIGE